MKSKLSFLLIICLAIILSFLVYIHPVSAQPQCPGSSGCPVITSTGAYRGPTRRELLELIQELGDLIAQGKVTEAERILTEFLKISEVQVELQEIESQQIQIQFQPGEVQVRQLPEIPTERLLRTIQAPQIRPEIVSPQIQSLQRQLQ